MRTIVVDTGGTGDYTSLNAAIVALQSSGLSDDTTIDCRATTGLADTTPVTVENIADNGFTLEIGSYGSNCHNGLAGTGYVLDTTGSTAIPLLVMIGKVTINGLEVTSASHGGSNNGLITISHPDLSGAVTVKKCLVHKTDTASSYSHGISVITLCEAVICNNVVYDIYGDGIYQKTDDFTTPVLIYNNTVTKCNIANNAYRAGIALGNVENTCILKNNLVVENTYQDYFLGTNAHSDSTNNLTSDDTAPGANAIQNATVQFVDAANNDYRLAASDTSGAIDGGADLSSDANLPVTDDIIGTGRPQGTAFDIGAFELIASNGTSVLVSDAGQGADDLLNSILLGITETGAGVDGFAGNAAVNQFDEGAGLELIKNIANNLIISDSGAGADAINILSELFLAVADAGIGIDNLAHIATTIFLNDSAAGIDLISGLAARAAITDSGNGLDLVKSILNNLLISDQGSGLDLINSLLASMAVVDLAAGTDSVSIIYEALILIADSGMATDEINNIINDFILSDLAAGSDNLILTVLTNILDAGAGVDTVAGILSSLFVSDTADGLETLQILKNVLIGISDSATGSDLIGTISNMAAVTDSGAGTDFLNGLKNILTLADSGAGTEQIFLLIDKLLTLADNGSGSDLVSSILAGAAISDLGGGADALAINILTGIKDQAGGSDNIYKSFVSILLNDSGSAVDLIDQIANKLQITEAGAGAETLEIFGKILNITAKYCFNYSKIKSFTKNTQKDFKKTINKNFIE